MRRRELIVYLCSKHVIGRGKVHMQFSYGGPIGHERSQRGNSSMTDEQGYERDRIRKEQCNAVRSEVSQGCIYSYLQIN